MHGRRLSGSTRKKTRRSRDSLFELGFFIAPILGATGVMGVAVGFGATTASSCGPPPSFSPGRASTGRRRRPHHRIARTERRTRSIISRLKMSSAGRRGGCLCP
ncbi:MAG: hypothetical protein C3F18_02475 [Nitrosomonadales bacterium]|nr:MAG: hypothetical protein C3F18_02475 [Nitrosomonadales bacterium]